MLAIKRYLFPLVQVTILCIVVTAMISGAWANRQIPDDQFQDTPSEFATVIAVVKVMNVEPESQDGLKQTRIFVKDGIKGIRTGTVLDLVDGGRMVRSGEYLVRLRNDARWHYAIINVFKVWIDRDFAAKMIRKVRDDFAATEEAKLEAARLYPDLADSRSKLNAEFVRRFEKYRENDSVFFSDARWPVTLAKECAENIK